MSILLKQNRYQRLSGISEVRRLDIPVQHFEFIKGQECPFSLSKIDINYKKPTISMLLSFASSSDSKLLYFGMADTIRRHAPLTNRALIDRLKEIIAFVIHQNKRGKIFHGDLPNGFHAEFREVDNFLRTDVITR